MYTALRNFNFKADIFAHIPYESGFRKKPIDGEYADIPGEGLDTPSIGQMGIYPIWIVCGMRHIVARQNVALMQKCGIL
jgi:hypothetical protein